MTVGRPVVTETALERERRRYTLRHVDSDVLLRRKSFGAEAPDVGDGNSDMNEMNVTHILARRIAMGYREDEDNRSIG